ncbi:MAG: lanthionine synthetase C family protein [Actinomycetota bacterium]|nr:lanthionine synthetase C family protein [Actinomycetota bacterium]
MTLLAEGLDHRQRRTAQAVAADLSEALAMPPPAELGDDRGPSSPRWRGQSLSKGAAGVAVLHGMRGQGEPGGERVHAWLACAAREDLSAGPGAGLWFGAPAVAFAMSTAAPGQYPRAMKSLDAAIVTLVRARLEVALARLAAAIRPSLSEFDLVRGLTGLGAYLLRRDPHGELVRRVLTYLVRLTQPVPADDHAGLSAPGWWTSDVPSGQPADAFRGGHADLGMAHGIAGPLALLALAMKQGITVDGHAGAIEGICHWLNTWCHEAATGPWWPERVSLAELRTGRSVHPGPTRPSWCYGTPGLARAQQLAGQALGDPVCQQRAEYALARCLSDPAQLARITDPALCHGWAGLIATAWCAAADARCPEIGAHLPRLIDTLLEYVQADDSSPSRGPGLIEGSAGVALTLQSVTTPTDPRWLTCLLLN